MKKLMCLMISIMMFIGLVGCGQSKNDTQSSAGDKAVIVMGTNAEFPPFEYREGDNVEGFDVEIAKKVAEKLGVELQIEDMLFDGLIPALEAGKIDFIAAGMSVTEERKQNVDFSNGYYEASQVIIVTKDNDTIKGPEDLKNKKIGVQLGTTGDAEAQNIEGAEVVQFNAGFAAIMDLQNGKVDAVVLDSEPAKNFAAQNDQIKILDVELTQEEYAIAVKKGNTELVDAINSVLEEMKNSGEYDELVKKYFTAE
ncbi:basic amino acid ABC transporter substrate-binding protein [Defluviitalea saccharophila]|uniref:Basic amino acid ABC transporter substrate-binding protein n=1 Tax=Defluviitalea saccharophila TaxID=879970 RepID=A0ABZ2Y2M7_9FIRM